ncbi:MAG TPA: hypothetical protein VK524_03515, partial [Polyangiaceae bacterium]|nr:hypothetical protein [Polyangiaceae bacterium]
MRRSSRLFVAAAAAGLAGFAAREVHAAPCSQLTNPVYGAGGSAFTPTFQVVAPVLLRANPPITLVYQDPSACDGYGRFGDSPQPSLTGTARFWDASGTEQSCTIETSENIKAQFSTMGNSIALCPGRTLASDIRDFEGPVQTVNVIVPAGSSESSISAQALYHIFGLATPGQVGPWGDRRYLVKRRAGSFVHAFVAQAAGLPVESFIADTEVTTNQATLVEVKRIGALSAAALQGALGYVSGPNAEADDGVRTLAYQHVGQTCGYWPNSTENSRDKANVRNGQYYLWASNHFFARVDG